ncbi:MAG: DUF177 domain-containing protein [Candidatus Omnitrophica bacterium]|jgi:uncharacterized protein|nr:DUF177 domain-containing protein [Candidatus Omnitrophota bacterium]
MKIYPIRIASEGLSLVEEIPAQDLELEVEGIKFCAPVAVRAQVTRITNAVTAELSLSTTMDLICGRCLEHFTQQLNKDFRLSYQVEQLNSVIDLNPEIREEIILDYPVKPLCRNDCKGLCPKCGANLNEKKCNC